MPYYDLQRKISHRISLQTGKWPASWASDYLLMKGMCMHTVTKKELVDRIAEQAGTKRVVVKKIVQSFLDEIIAELAKGSRLEFRDFGVFESKARAARIAQNPKTLQRVQVPPKRTVKFKVGRMMKQKLQHDLTA